MCRKFAYYLLAKMCFKFQDKIALILSGVLNIEFSEFLFIFGNILRI